MELIKIRPLVARLSEEVLGITRNEKIPGLAVLLGAPDPDAIFYADSILKTAEKLNIDAKLFNYSKEDEFIGLIKGNELAGFGGILALSPYPDKMDENRLQIIPPHKDVDCITHVRIGELNSGVSKLAPATAAAVIEIIDHFRGDITGARVTVVGRSLRVGKPLMPLLLQRNATVTLCHSRTKNLEERTAEADIVITAIGKAELLTREFFSDGQIIIDVGINRTDDGFTGDVRRKDLKEMDISITKVPGGVGTVTTIVIFKNLLDLMI